MLRRGFRTAHPPSPWLDRLPIRSELFGIERLEEHARSFAAAQPIATRHVPAPVCLADWPRTQAFCSTPVALSRRALAVTRNAHPPPNG